MNCAFKALTIVGVSSITLAGCVSNSQTVTSYGDRELRPPRGGIEVGSLYYVREQPTTQLGVPANLERLCDFNLNTAPNGYPVADINLWKQLKANGGITAVKSILVSAGINGNVERYFTYKAVNVRQHDISFAEAGQLYEEFANRPQCSKWRKSINDINWGIYQIQSIKRGDLVFEIKNSTNLTANIKAKLRSIEPEIKSTISSEHNLKFSGKQLILSFAPINRN